MAVAAAETYIAVDSIPEVAAARTQVREEALALVEQRRRQMISGQETDLPVPVDALSTADSVWAARERFGFESPEAQEKFEGLLLDCQRLVAEWYRKNKPEYFPAVRHIFNPDTEEFYSHGLSISQMTLNALRPVPGDREETDRRVNERVEDATPRIMRQVGGIALGGVGLRTISECTDKAIADYEADKDAKSFGGYVPQIKKMMIRDIRFDEETGDRFEEQIGLPGTIVNDWVVREALRRRSVDAKEMSKTELHGTQLLVNDSLMDFVRLLDQVASENYAGANIFMGEAVPTDHPRDYEAFQADALQRQSSLKNFARGVALYVLDLSEEGVNRREAPGLVEEFVKMGLLNLGKLDYRVAEQMFDARTAEGLQRVAQLEALGMNDEAARLMMQVTEQAPGGGYCGAGSCGLEFVKLTGRDSEDMKKLGFESKNSLKDTERRCRRCHAKRVYYDLKQGQKGCAGCDARAKY